MYINFYIIMYITFCSMRIIYTPQSLWLSMSMGLPGRRIYFVIIKIKFAVVIKKINILFNIKNSCDQGQEAETHSDNSEAIVDMYFNY